MQTCLRRDVYGDYLREMRSKYRGERIASLEEFLEVWRVLFPNCVIRPFSENLGKCWICAEKDIIFNDADSSPEERKAAADIHAIHRAGCYMRERSAYMMRKQYAMDNPGTP